MHKNNPKRLLNHPDFSEGESWFNLDRTGAPFFLDAYLKTWGLAKQDKFKDLYYPFGELEQAYLFFQGDRFYGRWWAMRKFAESILEYLVHDKNFEDYLKNKDEFIKDMDKVWETYTYERVLTMSSDEAIVFALTRQDDLVRSWIADAIAPFIGEIATPYMQWWFDEKGIVQKDRSEIFNLILTYPKISATIERQLTIKKELDNAKEGEKGNVIYRLVQRFAYSKSDFIGYVSYSKEDVLKEYELAKSITVNLESDILHKEKVLAGMNITPIDRKVFDIFAYCTFSRDERRAYQQRLFALLDWSLEVLSKSYNIPQAILRYTTIDELTGVNLSSPNYKKILQNRFENGFMIYWVDRNSSGYLYGDEAKDKFESLDKSMDINKEIKGQVTFKGKVTGKVRIIMDPKEPVPDEPFVLVAGMTSPDYIQHMQKCIAIVTNEGGITCHAAILSRELKKPCIIGTKIATKVLKSGDLVEVDAEKGIVTKI
jgi:phosphohistidine swiveling domain-containing protein